MKPKVAYLFLTYGNVSQPKLWERYFQGHEDTTLVCCHATNRAEVTVPFLKNNLIPYWVSTQWGGLGLVIAQIELIRYALRDPDVQRLVLCSDTCCPIKTYAATYNALFETDKTWLPTSTKIIERMSKVTHIDVKSHRKNDQWVMLNRRHAMMLVRFNYTADFTRCVVPDEHYVSTVLTHLGEEESLLQRCQTSISWHRISQVQFTPNEYVELPEDFVDKWRGCDSILARKFTKNSNIYERWYDIVS